MTDPTDPKEKSEEYIQNTLDNVGRGFGEDADDMKDIKVFMGTIDERTKLLIGVVDSKLETIKVLLEERTKNIASVDYVDKKVFQLKIWLLGAVATILVGFIYWTYSWLTPVIINAIKSAFPTPN